jgi:hypothetical protein
MAEFIIANMAPLMFGALVVFLLSAIRSPSRWPPTASSSA